MLLKKKNIISNEKIDYKKVEIARSIITELQKEIPSYTSKGYGPFVAAIYNEKGELISKAANSVLNTACSNNHAEINVIKLAEEKFCTHDLSKYNLKLFITAEPCMMCAGAILWSGIKEVYYGVPTNTVEKITGFDEGFKKNLMKEFKKRGIIVYGNIEPKLGEKELSNYVNNHGIVYKPANAKFYNILL